MEAVAFVSAQALADWAHAFEPSDEESDELASLALEMSVLGFLLSAITSPSSTACARSLLAGAVAQRLYRALDLQHSPPIAVDDLVVRKIARVVPVAPELREELPAFVQIVLKDYA